MTSSGENGINGGREQPGQQTDTGTGHGVRGHGGQDVSKGVSVLEEGGHGRLDEAEEDESRDDETSPRDVQR